MLDNTVQFEINYNKNFLFICKTMSFEQKKKSTIRVHIQNVIKGTHLTCDYVYTKYVYR